MTSVFDKHGRHLPVTVHEVGPCTVLQRKTVAAEGYDAVQCGFGEHRESRTTKALVGHCKKSGATPKRHLREFELDPGEDLKAGDVVTATMFQGIAFVDVTGITKGRGFQGVVKRYRMRGGPMTHGGASKRRIGAIGCRALPGRIHKNKRMPGHMGHLRVTTQNLRVVQVVPEDNLLVVQGAVAGPTGGLVAVTKARKTRAAKTS